MWLRNLFPNSPSQPYKTDSFGGQGDGIGCRSLPTNDPTRFATGRSALEALACGCAVVPLDPVVGLGTLVTPEDFDQHRNRNWCVYQKPRDVTADDVATQLARVDAAAAAHVTRRVRQELTLVHAASGLEIHYQRVLEDCAAGRSGDGAHVPLGEAAALVGYLRFLAARTRESDTVFAEVRRAARLAEKLPAVREEAAAARRERHGLLRRLQASWWGRRFLRRHGGWQIPPSG